MTREIPLVSETPFVCSKFAPPNGPFMLDDVVVFDKRTCLYFTEDLGTIITAGAVGKS